MKKISCLLSAMAMALMASSAQSAVTIDFTQSASGVTADISGSIDPSSFTLFSNGSFTANNVASRGGQITAQNGSYDTYRISAIDLTAFGSGFSTNATSGTGVFALIWNGAGNHVLRLPTGYVAGSALSASLFFSGATFASLDINPTNVSSDLGGGQIVNFVFNTAPPPAVPEPASWAMMVGGLGLVGATMRRRKINMSFA